MPAVANSRRSSRSNLQRTHMNSSSEELNACAHHGRLHKHCAKDSTDPNANGHHSFESGPLFEFVTEEPLSPLGCFDAPSAEANGCFIQSFNFVPRSPKNSGFGLQDGRTTDGRTKLGSPPNPPWFFEQETATELGSRFPFICGFKQSKLELQNHLKICGFAY